MNQTLNAVEFPRGCPLDNITTVCKALRDIPTNSFLLFSDGWEMPACAMATPSKDQYRALELRKILSDSLQGKISGAQMNLILNIHDEKGAQDIFQKAGVPFPSSLFAEFLEVKKRTTPPDQMFLNPPNVDSEMGFAI